MKRAPVIPKTSFVQPTQDVTTSPAAPMVDSLISRVGAMAKGNSFTLPVCGREVKLVLEVVPAGTVETATRVWSGNERDQGLLTEESLDDLIPSFLTTGQQVPAFGRRVGRLIEVADGSRRRKTAILTSREYRILVGDLDDEQMDALCKLGNEYRPTSAFERGQRYATRLEAEFEGNITALAEAERISRKIITRCLNTARLPREVIALFSHPGELSARAGDALFKQFSENMSVLAGRAHELAQRKKAGFVYETDEITEFLRTEPAKPKPAVSPCIRKQIAPGASVRYSGHKVTFSLDRNRLPADIVSRIEELLATVGSAKNST